MEGGSPGTIVWPTDGNLIYNPNTGANWILQNVAPNFNLSTQCPDGFLVGIDFLYNHPSNDAIGCDDTGPGPYDWTYYSGAWGPAAYGKNAVRALINDIGNPGVETTTLGQMRALYR
jgi:hypothetical protein